MAIPGKTRIDENCDKHPSPVSFDRIFQLQKQIEDLKSRWPAHSTPPSMLQRLEELEDELENQREKLKLLERS